MNKKKLKNTQKQKHKKVTWKYLLYFEFRIFVFFLLILMSKIIATFEINIFVLIFHIIIIIFFSF